jgi:tetratricopeptide (TPR) repeat protein
MSAHIPVTRQSLGRTFVVAATVLGLMGAAQIGAVSWKFIQSAGLMGDGSRRPPSRIDVQRLVSEMPPPEDPLAVSNDPLEGDPVTIGPTGARPVPVATPLDPRSASREEEDAVLNALARPFQPRPTPVPLSVLTPKVSPQFTELVEQGKLLRNSGDTAGALVKFREAAALEPANAQAIAEQAYTFEKMSLYDKAAEQWRRVLAMGENAGVLYSAARSKLDMAMAETIRTVSPTSSPQAIEEGKIVGLDVPMRQDESSPTSAKKFVLFVPIRVRPGEKIKVKDVKLIVQFYDRLNGKEIVDTAANTGHLWSRPPPNWADEDTETAECTYDLPPSHGLGEGRDYYGYIARLYYQNELQDIHAEPAALTQRFPAAHTLSE